MPGRPAHSWEAADTYLQQVFDTADANKDGKLVLAELKAALRELSGDSTSDEDVELLMKKLDRDADGAITKTEFISAMLNSSEDWLDSVLLDDKAPHANGNGAAAPVPGEDGTHDWDGAEAFIRSAFREADADQDGKIDAGEIKALLNSLSGADDHSDEDVQLLLKQIDSDHDGKVTESEFVAKIMTSSEDWLQFVSLA